MTDIVLTTPQGRAYAAQIPQSWGEVPAQHLSRLLHAAYAAADPVGARLKAIRKMSGWPMRLLWQIDPLDLYFIQDTLQWIEHPTHEMPFPFLTIGSLKYYLPGDGFEEATCLQWALADEYFHAMEKDANAVMNLAAVIITHEVTDRKDVAAMAAAMRDTDATYLAALVSYFAGVKTYVHKMYGSYLFKQADEDDQPRGPQFGWWGVFLSVAESGTFGTYDQVLQTNFHTLCVYLVQKQQEADEARRRMKNPKAFSL